MLTAPYGTGVERKMLVKGEWDRIDNSMGYQDYVTPAYQILLELPSAETVTVMARFQEDTYLPPDNSGGPSSPSSYAQSVILKHLRVGGKFPSR